MTWDILSTVPIWAWCLISFWTLVAMYCAYGAIVIHYESRDLLEEREAVNVLDSRIIQDYEEPFVVCDALIDEDCESPDTCNVCHFCQKQRPCEHDSGPQA